MVRRAKKIFSGFRLAPETLRELRELAEAAGLTRTEVVEVAILSARGPVGQLIRQRAERLEGLGKRAKP